MQQIVNMWGRDEKQALRLLPPGCKKSGIAILLESKQAADEWELRCKPPMPKDWHPRGRKALIRDKELRDRRLLVITNSVDMAQLHAFEMTVALMEFEFEGEKHPCRHEFRVGWPASLAVFHFEENNGSCDCTRLQMINEQHGTEFDDEDCGDEVQMTDLRIVFEAVQWDVA